MNATGPEELMSEADLVAVMELFDSQECMNKFFKSLGITQDIMNDVYNMVHSGRLIKLTKRVLTLWTEKRGQQKATRQNLLDCKKTPMQYISKDAMQNLQEYWSTSGEDIAEACLLLKKR